MEKALIREHLNTIDFLMSATQVKVDILEDALKWNSHYYSKESIETDKEYIDFLKEKLCDLDTIRQEYQKELDK